MSVAQPHTPPTPHGSSDQREITIVSHSNLFYWWPVWTVAFLLGVITQLFGDKMVTVPNGTKAGYQAEGSALVKNDDGTETRQKFDGREVLFLPEKEHLHRLDGGPADKAPDQPKLNVWPRKGFGVL